MPANKLFFELHFTGEYAAIPERMQEALKRYVLESVKPGDFLSAVLSNDLRNAVGRADRDNVTLLPLYIRWLYNVAPGNCWGSPENFETWLARPQE
ncbi:MAG: hypothetical protein EBZ69_00825 [Alphaproteobacteria bacterium]|nr:hypothetical protein [Alphaproteobacteria bacterium]NDG04822.1 hypothetical protein [Alphaproteobacteria bacterium]